MRMRIYRKSEFLSELLILSVNTECIMQGQVTKNAIAIQIQQNKISRGQKTVYMYIYLLRLVELTYSFFFN